MHGCLLGVIECGGVIWFRDGGGGGVQGGKIGAVCVCACVCVSMK